MLYDEQRWDVELDPELDKIGHLLMKAADSLEKGRWAQGNYLLLNGARCAVGHLMKIDGVHVDADTMTYDEKEINLTTKAYERLNDYLSTTISRYTTTYKDVTTWNDCHTRKKEEVVAAMRSAAKFKG